MAEQGLGQWGEILHIFIKTMELLSQKWLEMYWCIINTVATAAKAPGHQYPQCWLNVKCIGPVSYQDTHSNWTNLESEIIFLENDPVFKGWALNISTANIVIKWIDHIPHRTLYLLPFTPLMKIMNFDHTEY